MSLVDKILLRENPHINSNYTDFNSRYFYHSNSPQWLIFLPWNNSIEQGIRYGLVPKIGNGLVYEVPRSIVGITPHITVESLNEMREDFTIKQATYNLSPDIISGFSIGTLSASYFSKYFNIKRLNLIAPGARLGENIWSAPLAQWVKKEAIKNNFTSPEIYDEQMIGVNSIDCSSFFPRDTRIFYGTKDVISPPKNVEKLIESITTVPKIKKLPFGHIGTILVSSRYNIYK